MNAMYWTRVAVMAHMSSRTKKKKYKFKGSPDLSVRNCDEEDKMYTTCGICQNIKNVHRKW